MISPALNHIDKIIIFVLAILLGYLSWRLLEQPFRKFSLDKIKLHFNTIVTLPVVAYGLVFLYSSNRDFWFVNNQSKYETYIGNKVEARIGTCFLTTGYEDPSLFNKDTCINVGNNKNILVIGDSHSAQYFHALQDIYPDYNISQITASGCRPTTSYSGPARCSELMRYGFEEAILDYDFELVILGGRWFPVDITPLSNTLDMLIQNNINTVVIGPVVEYNQPLPVLLSRFPNRESIEPVQISNARIYQTRNSVNTLIKQLAENKNVGYVDVFSKMCPEKRCITTLDDVPMQFDHAHLTPKGARFLIKNEMEKFLLSK